MSLHSQLLRGLFALPLTLLLAIAGVMAPDAPSSAAAAPATAALPPVPAFAFEGGVVVPPTRLVVERLPRHDCPRVVRVQVARR